MDTKGKSVSTKWLITRRLRVRRKQSKQFSALFVGVGVPRKLRKQERSPIFPDHHHGCEVQMGSAITRHIVYGRNAFSALTHALLAVEQFLRITCQKDEVHDEFGERFDPTIELVFLGAIGRQYRKAK